jgi:hypothetical protein
MLTLTRNRPAAVAVAVAAVLAAAGLTLPAAEADDATVSAETDDPSRELRLLDLTGEPLEELELRDGVPQGFETRVVDREQDPGNDFDVESTLNNLHRRDADGNLVADDLIASENVDLGYATDPAGARSMAVGADVTTALASAEPISCQDVNDLLGVLVADDPICNLISDLLGINLGSLTSSDTIEFSGVDLAMALDPVAIDDLPLADLPLVPGEGDTGPYTEPECNLGIASSFCDGDNPTKLNTLQSSPNGTLASEIESRLIDAATGGDLVGTDGPVTVDDVLSAMRNSNQSLLDANGNAVGGVGELADAIGQYDAGEQVTLVNNLLAATLDQVGAGDLARLQGTHRSFPSLTVTTGGATGGSYQGTLTVTLIE